MQCWNYKIDMNGLPCYYNRTEYATTEILLDTLAIDRML